VQGQFTQLNADGSVSTGTIYLHRPGRIRFEYDPPEPALVMAGGGTVAVFDLKTRAAPEQFPLSRTPLSLILARDVNLARSGMVIAHDSDGLSTSVVLQDPEQPELGHIRLIFTADPVELRQWVIRDGGGQETTVILGDLERGASLPPRLFDIGAEADRITGRGDAP
ncbi:MAG: outer membrane lipoprotein carrier protein LolA, partial [Rhodobacteraceae bacterium]|nr:outer membrane lipoprotein carrier protein LolA [Paracoccaceae bacterium]